MHMFIESKKPSVPVISDRGHDRRMKKRRGQGKEDSDDEEVTIALLLMCPFEFLQFR